MDDTLAERLAQIERRLDALEAASPEAEVPEAEGPEAPLPTAADFWALAGLRDRAGPPGAVLFTGLVDLPSGEHYEWQQGFPVEGIVESDWTALSPALAALAHPTRLQILREVLRGAGAAAELQAVEGIESTGQLYHHVRQLIAAGWLRTTGRAHYAVPGERVIPLLVMMACAQR
ncbi:helix-turn-helix domain-containing protein [Actinoplanes sp. CA-030573]|uniref:helix-turn-helix domain-containing protein n=1 Tax=Actinoplanes sp. CA-030573 TaxID=3239898 RepID=UPI003D8D75E7